MFRASSTLGNSLVDHPGETPRAGVAQLVEHVIRNFGTDPRKDVLPQWFTMVAERVNNR